ncbi:MAG: GNAT family N-acetyltransferase [Gammaproteobacteria bacterium]|nr:GNAT family N-acetyltransferase [Gammaproteobacteria bacterium]
MTPSPSTTSVRDLMNIHLAALFTHDARARIVRVNESGGSSAPRFAFGMTTQGNVWRFRHDLADDLVGKLEALCQAEPTITDLGQPPRHRDAYIRILSTSSPVEAVSAGPAFYLPNESSLSATTTVVTDANIDVLRGGLEAWVPDVAYRQPFHAVVRDRRAISVCCSVRITPDAHEAGVETLENFRGRGYATTVVTGWVGAVRRMGCVPMYSTSWENTASQAVARKSRLVQYGTDFHIT